MIVWDAALGKQREANAEEVALVRELDAKYKKLAAARRRRWEKRRLKEEAERDARRCPTCGCCGHDGDREDE